MKFEIFIVVMSLRNKEKRFELDFFKPFYQRRTLLSVAGILNLPKTRWGCFVFWSFNCIKVINHWFYQFSHTYYLGYTIVGSLLSSFRGFKLVTSKLESQIITVKSVVQHEDITGDPAFTTVKTYSLSRKLKVGFGMTRTNS